MQEASTAKQIKVTYESDSLLILRGGCFQRAFCSACGVEVDVITVEHTELVSNLTRAAFERWFALSDLHRFETTNGLTLLCLNSLLGSLQGQPSKAQR